MAATPANFVPHAPHGLLEVKLAEYGYSEPENLDAADINGYLI